MRIINLLKRPSLYLGIAICVCSSNCSSDDDSSSSSIIATFQPGFNPQTLQTFSQVWLINNANSSNIVASVASPNTINYSYTFSGQTVKSDGTSFIFNSLGTSATLDSSFNFTGVASTYSLLTTELANSTSPLSIAVAAFDSSDAAAADIIKAANDAVPNLIIFYNAGTFYTLDSLRMVTNNNNQGTQTFIGSPILFTSSQARQGVASQFSQVSTVEVSYRTPID